jgi:hypothetical protein
MAGALLLGLAIGGYLHHTTASPAPFGAPLPPIGTLLNTEGIDFKHTDVLERRIPPPYVEFLAPQPDGTPPLKISYTSQRGGFSLRLPHGSETTQLDPQSFARDSVDALIQFHFNQPLQEVVVTLPGRKDGETVSEFAARLRFEFLRLGWEPVDTGEKELDLPRYRFARLEAVVHPPRAAQAGGGTAAQADAAGDQQRIWYVGPLGERLLVVEFSAKRENAELARNQAAKIMSSFSPSFDLAIAMLEEDPKYGEWAGTSNVELAEKRQLERSRAAGEANQKP